MELNPKTRFRQIGASIRSFFRTTCQVAIIAVTLSGTASAKKNPIPAAVQSAKTVYLENETGNDKVLETASDQFTDWGRFAISKSRNHTALLVVFSHKSGMSKWGNVGITEMDVFVEGQKEPVFTAKEALKLLGDRQHPTKACIHHFREWLEN